jgi:predicted ribosome-associated RNA-binding protein Tma20
MKNLSQTISLGISKSIFIALFLLTGCAQMIPGLEQALDDYVKDDAVCVTIHREAIREETDIIIQIAVMNNGEIPTGDIKR